MGWTLQTHLENPSTDTEKEVAKLGPWFHNLHLPDGTQTAPRHPLGDFPSFKWNELKGHLPEDMSGLTVLDIGCNSGFYSFQLARRGAKVRAIDVDEHYLRQAKWAAEIYGLSDRIDFEHMPLYELARENVSYDIVWFMGVLYHLRYPQLALDIISQKVNGLLVMQCLTTNDRIISDDTHYLGFDDVERMSRPGWPSMAFIEHELLGDPTNWWLPNEAGLQAMLRSAGFCINAHPAKGTYICARDAASPFAHQSELRAAVGPGASPENHEI